MSVYSIDCTKNLTWQQVLIGAARLDADGNIVLAVSGSGSSGDTCVCPWLLSGSNIYNDPLSANVAIGNATAAHKLDVYGKIGISGTQMIYLPNQTNYVGTLFLGNGGSALNNTGVEAGDFNTYVGIGTGIASTVAKKNTALGYNALTATTSGWANTAIGYNALSTGIGTGNLNISGTGVEFYANTAVGSSVLSLATTASYNTGVGVNSLLNLTTGISNTAVGVHCLDNNIIGNYNTAVGRDALYSNLSDGNTAFGASAGYSHAGAGQITAFGYQAGYKNNNAGQNIYFGYQAGFQNTAGYENTFIGHQAGLSAITKNQYFNTVIGFQSGYLAGNNEGNTYIGWKSGYPISTGTYNTFIGYTAGYNGSQLATATNSTAIGNGTYTTASNTVVIGNTAVTNAFISNKFEVKRNSLVDNTQAGSAYDAGSYIDITPGTSGGMGYLMIGDAEEYAWFMFTSAAVVTLITYSANVVNTNTDAKFCVVDNGATVRISNALGATKTMSGYIIYNQ